MAAGVLPFLDPIPMTRRSPVRSRGARFLASAALAVLPLRLPAQGQQRLRSLDEALAASGALSGGAGPRDVNWIDNGNRFSYIGHDSAGGDVIRSYEPATGRDALLFSSAGLTFPGTAEPFAYRSFEWSHDSRHLVFQTHFRQLYRRSGVSDYYVYSLADRSLQLAARTARTAELSPDGTMIGYERDGDMYVDDLAHRAERRLTRDAAPHVYDGHFDWVYEEEFGMAQAWNWSPDSRHIAFWQLDDHAEPVVQLSDYAGRHPMWDTLRIPQPGDSNATARIGVVDVHTGKRVWLDPGLTGEYYIPRIYWTSRPDTIAVVTLNRPQNQLHLFFFDVRTGGRRLVMQETSRTWIDVYDFYAGIQDMMTFPAGTHEFFWISDRDGWQHVYRYDYSGKLLGQVTRGRWSVTRVEGIDPARQALYYTSTEVSPLQRHLYAIRFDGTGKRRVTAAEGTHHIDMSPNTRYYLDSWSSVREPRQVALFQSTGKALHTFEANARVRQWLATHAYSPAVPFSFVTSDSVRLDASMIRPVPFDPSRKYPVILSIYGGPGSQGVYDQFDASGMQQWQAQHGYIVVNVNNRGTNNYGSAFMKVVYRQLGKWESHDFAETARYLATLPYVDAKHIGITGGSYGGYSAMYTMEMYPQLFAAGVSNSGVADWRLYDTIYTERYMGLLGDNLAGYRASSAVVNAPKLAGHLLMIHSMMDDNVHPQNTMQMLTAFANAGKDVPVRLYPPGRHGAAYNLQSYRLIQEASDAFLARYLGGIPDSAAVRH